MVNTKLLFVNVHLTRTCSVVHFLFCNKKRRKEGLLLLLFYYHFIYFSNKGNCDKLSVRVSLTLYVWIQKNILDVKLNYKKRRRSYWIIFSVLRRNVKCGLFFKDRVELFFGVRVRAPCFLLLSLRHREFPVGKEINFTNTRGKVGVTCRFSCPGLNVDLFARIKNDSLFMDGNDVMAHAHWAKLL